MGEWLAFAADRLPELWLRTGEHLMLTGVSTGAAVAVGVPLGILVWARPNLRGPVLGAAGILQTIPSLAMLVLLLALFGRIGVMPALVALLLYALLPIVRNTITALDGIDPELEEAARALGMTRGQQLRIVQIPIAVPVIAAGIRTAAVIGVGIATLSAFIGAGGLGDFINRGLALADTDLILLGALPAAALALLVDGSIAGVEWGLDRRRWARRKGPRWAVVRGLVLGSPAALVVVAVAAYASTGAGPGGGGRVVIGSKNFTEQLVLGEIMAQTLEARTDLAIVRRFNLGGTMICHGALLRGEIDLYPEYTGTALTAILEASPATEPGMAHEQVASAYRERFGLEWLPPFGFDNAYVLLVREEEAERRGWEAVSDLVRHAPRMAVGMTAEFAERPDGWSGFREAYRLGFRVRRDLDPGILYRAVMEGEVDAAFGFATDGRIAVYDLRPLVDDRGFFPPYQAAPVLRRDLVSLRPEAVRALRELAGLIPDSTMRRLNHEVDVEGRAPADVARRFLAERGIVGGSEGGPGVRRERGTASGLRGH